MTLEPNRPKRKYIIRSNAPRAVSPGVIDLERIALARYGRSREDLVRAAAHARAAERGFVGGDPVADWLAAEAAIDAELTSRDPES